ncbi:hypothetical protein AAUPMB_07597 [Pasteurella multocida subsp. multocida str. Anand1_buffalo]|nr:hypothetical protein AAUPMB_07597 [Pasteurella multocida subsp. multocida str. Anand1_buffalo]
MQEDIDDGCSGGACKI